MLHHLIIVSFLQCWLQYPSIVHLFFAAKESLWCKLILSVMFLSWAVMNCHSVSLTMDPAQLHIYAKQSRASRNCCCLINEHTHIATGSANALWQIRNNILYLQRMKRHKYGKLLETIVHHIHLSKDTIHFSRKEKTTQAVRTTPHIN